jgi:chromosome segregation ATPase
MDEINKLQEQIKALQSDLKIKEEQEEYARKLLAEEKGLTESMKVTLSELEDRIENLENELKLKSESLMNVTKEYNELRSSRFMRIVELLEKLFPKK